MLGARSVEFVIPNTRNKNYTRNHDTGHYNNTNNRTLSPSAKKHDEGTTRTRASLRTIKRAAPRPFGVHTCLRFTAIDAESRQVRQAPFLRSQAGRAWRYPIRDAK